MTKIKLFDPITDREEEIAIMKVLKSGFWASGTGTGNVEKFEKKFQEYTGSKECVAVNSGTAALHLALSTMNIKNKEVIVPSLSFVSTAHSVLYNGGTPIFADVDPLTLCLDPEDVKKKIGEKTAAIIPVHFAGMPSNLNKLSTISKEHHIPLIEDAAHACGAKYNNKKIGTHGNMVCFSFHPVKNLAMPSGGLISINQSDHKKLRDILLARRWCGITNRREVFYDIKEIGWNFYMNEFSAAIGIAQLKKLDILNKRRKNIARRYSKEIISEYKMPYNNDCVYHFYWIIVKKRNSFRKEMKKKGIETGIHYKAIHKMNMYNNDANLPVTDNISEHIVSIPTHPNLSDEDIDKIINSINILS